MSQDRVVHPTFVSLNPCLDDILVNVADPDQILALSHYSRDPSGTSVGVDVARQFGVTGGTAEEVLALDPDIVLALIAHFKACAVAGQGVVIVLHDLALAMNRANRVLVLREGRLVTDGPPDQALSPDVNANAWGVKTQWIGKPGAQALVTQSD